MATTNQGTPYVVGSDVAGAYPEVSRSLADHIDNKNASQDTAIDARVRDTGDTMTGPLIVPSIEFADTYIGNNSGETSWVGGSGTVAVDVTRAGDVGLPTLAQSLGGAEITESTHLLVRLASGQIKHVDRTWMSLWLNQGQAQTTDQRIAELEARITELEATR